MPWGAIWNKAYTSGSAQETLRAYNDFKVNGQFIPPRLQRNAGNRKDEWYAGVIKSILQGKTVPPIFLNTRSYDSRQAIADDYGLDVEDEAVQRVRLEQGESVSIRRVLDGGHRSEAIFKFLAGEIGVDMPDLNGGTAKLYYRWTSSAPPPPTVRVASGTEQNHFREYSGITVVGFTNLTDEQETEIFHDLNKSNPLTTGNRLRSLGGMSPWVNDLIDLENKISRDTELQIAEKKNRLLHLLDPTIFHEQDDTFLVFGCSLYVHLWLRNWTVDGNVPKKKAEGKARNILNTHDPGFELLEVVIKRIDSVPTGERDFMDLLMTALRTCQSLRLENRVQDVRIGNLERDVAPYAIFTAASRLHPNSVKRIERNVTKWELTTVFLLLWEGQSPDSIKQLLYELVGEHFLDFDSEWCRLHRSPQPGHTSHANIAKRHGILMKALQARSRRGQIRPREEEKSTSASDEPPSQRGRLS